MNNRSKSQLKSIPPDIIPNVLLIGNGINRCFSDISWDSILLEASNTNSVVSKEQQKLIDDMPYPLQAVVMSHDQVDVASNLISEKLLNLQWDKKQIGLLQEWILNLPVDAILTTNYSYEIENAIDSKFYCKKGCASKYRVTTRKTGKVDDQFNI